MDSTPHIETVVPEECIHLIGSQQVEITGQRMLQAGRAQAEAQPFRLKNAPGMSFEFRKRALHRGGSIGLHQHDKDEIYYVISGRGIYSLDGKDYEVGPGNAMLTRPGSTHGIRQTGEEDLALLITYRSKDSD